MNDNTEPLTEGLLGDFLDESSELMRRLNEGLLQLDRAVKGETGPIETDQELLNDIFRAAHSLKGLSGMLGLGDINALTHKVENVFDAIRCGRLSISNTVVDVAFQSLDRLEAMIELLKSASDDSVDCNELCRRIDDVLHGRGDEANIIAVDSVAPAANDPLHGIEDDSDVSAKYLAIFIDECDLTLDMLADVLIQEPNVVAVETLLIGCHRIKGSAASIGLRRVARVAHLMEDRLQDIRRREVPPSNDFADALLVGVDAIRGYVEILRSGKKTSDELATACKRLIELERTEGATPTKQIDEVQTVRCEVLKARLRDAIALLPKGSRGLCGTVQFEVGLPLVELKARLLLDKLHRCGNVFFCHPDEDDFETAADFTALRFGLVTATEAVRVEAELRLSGVRQVELEEFETCGTVEAKHEDDVAENLLQDEVASLETPKPSLDCNSAATTPTSPGAGSTSDSKAKPVETLRVDIERLDQLMSLAGQLVITKARFAQIGQKLKRLFADKSAATSLTEAIKHTDRLICDIDDDATGATLRHESPVISAKHIRNALGIVQRDMARLTEVRSLLNDLAEAVHQFDRVSDGIQKSVMDTRMVQIGPLFSRFKRVVRDLSRSGGKDIQLEIAGEHTELDKRMIDELGDPLIHLIRNSADHGIETPEARDAAGKPRHGTITLDAFHRGNRIIIKVSDDGRGLDAARIRAKAVAKGWMSEAEAEKLTDAQAHQLIWRPGFSTAEQVTEVSGRGMGMDIVWSKIEQLNGTVELFSAPGRGTTFEIKLPLTMAILPSLLMRIEQETFAVPVESVIEIVRLDAARLTTVYGRRMARVRGRVISLVRLHELFREVQVAPREELAQATIVVCGVEGREIGIIVDELLGEQDVVIKSLAENFQNVDGITGASILGDGRVALILDIAALVEMACKVSLHAPSELTATTANSNTSAMASLT